MLILKPVNQNLTAVLGRFHEHRQPPKEGEKKRKINKGMRKKNPDQTLKNYIKISVTVHFDTLITVLFNTLVEP